MNLKMIEPQRRYFQAMHTFSPSRVCFLEAETTKATVEFVREQISGLVESDRNDSVALFGKMIQWVRKNEA